MKTVYQQPLKFVLIVFSCLLWLSTTEIQAQRSFKIKGKLINQLTQKSVEFATVALHHLPDSAVVQGVVTDTAGWFTINNLAEGNYLIKASCVGFKKVIKGDIRITGDQPSVNLGSIGMNEDVKAIDEVVVEGERLKGTVEVDKTVYAINEKIAASATSGLELMRNVPAVQVDFQNNLSLQGSSKILILVDGKTRDKDFLAQLDPKSIDKIEVMTNPSVKYDADVTGVISIILKKEKKGGFSGRMELEIPQPGKKFSNSSFNLEYGYNRIRLFVSGDIHLEDWKIKNPLTRITHVNSDIISRTQIASGRGSWIYGGFNYGADWFVNDKNTLNFYANYRPGNGGNMRLNSNVTDNTNGTVSTILNSNTKDKNTDESEYYSVFYRRTFAKPTQELTVDLNYYIYNGLDDKTYQNQYLNPGTMATDSDVYRSENTDNRRNVVGLKIDYTHPLTSTLVLYAGYHNNNQWIDNNFNQVHGSKSIPASDLLGTHFRYSENRHSVYVNVSGKIKEFNWQGGMRYELSEIDLNKDTTTHYHCWLPQISLSQKLNKTQSLKLNYRRSIQRPGVNDLNPFVNHLDAVTQSSGNPDLKPSYSDKVELEYSIQLGSSFLSPSLYYNNFTGGFESITRLDGKISETKVENIGKGVETGFSLSGSVNIAKWWQLYPYFCVFNKDLKEIPEFNIAGASRTSWRTSFSNVFTLPKKFILFNFVQYNNPFITSEVVHKRDIIYGFGLEKDVLKDGKGKITFTAINPFMKTFSAQHTITQSKNYYEDSNLQIDLNNILYTVKFTYMFSSGKNIKKLERQKEIEKDGGRSVL